MTDSKPLVRRGVYDPWSGRWCDYPEPPVRKSDAPGAAMVLAITGAFFFTALGLWWVL